MKTLSTQPVNYRAGRVGAWPPGVGRRLSLLLLLATLAPGAVAQTQTIPVAGRIVPPATLTVG